MSTGNVGDARRIAEGWVARNTDPENLPLPSGPRFGTIDDQAALAGAYLAALDRLAAVEARLAKYEQPGLISTAQKVIEERARADAAQAQRDTLAGALRLIVKQPDTYTAIRRIASAALAAVAGEPA